jgi:hypothetical protein
MPEFVYRKNVQQLRGLLETTCNEALRELLLKELAKEETYEPRPGPPPRDRLAAHLGEHRRASGTKTPDRAG